MLSVDFLFQCLVLMLGEVFALTCANGCRLAIISNNSHMLKGLVIGGIIAVLVFVIESYYLLGVGIFGNESKGYVAFAILFALAYACKTIWRINKKYDKTSTNLNIKDVIL